MDERLAIQKNFLYFRWDLILRIRFKFGNRMFAWAQGINFPKIQIFEKYIIGGGGGVK